MEILTKSAQETQKLGEKLAAILKGGETLCLYGELGSGKTTFVQGLAKGLGIKKRILSPTFVMIRQYVIRNTQHATRSKQSMSHVTCHLSHFYHVDLYRIGTEKDVESLGLFEIWSDPDNIVAIEWPEKIEKILPKKRIDIYFEYLGENKRRIKIND